MTTDAIPIKRVRKPAPKPIADRTGVAEKVGYMMGKLEGIELRLEVGDQQRDRMEKKIDAIPGAMQDAFAPLAAQLAAGLKAHGDILEAHAKDIVELKLTDASIKASNESIEKWKTKALGAIAALMAVVGGAAGLIGMMYHK